MMSNSYIFKHSRKKLTETTLPTMVLASIIVFGNWGNGYAQEFSRASSKPRVLELTLTEAVFMALRQNRSLESSYMDRVLKSPPAQN